MKYVETEKVELKKVLNETFEKEVVAFLNTDGGVIYIGVEDDGRICGVDNIDDVMKKISDILIDGIVPNPQSLISLKAIKEDDKWILEVVIEKGKYLYYIKRYGRSNKGCYIRVGTSVRSMTEEQIEIRYNKIYIHNKELTDIPSKLSKLMFRELKIYYAEKNLHLNEDTFEKNLNLLTPDGKYNMLAELLADENRVSIKIARFKGKDKSELLEKSEYGYKCLLVAIDRMINRLEAENYTMSVIKGARRVDKRLVDMDSLREIFINAIAHNDWLQVEPAVYIFSDRIEIISHGGLPNEQTKDNFYEGISKPRNKGLMRILSDLEYVEQTGHGIPDVVKIYGKDIFVIHDTYVNVKIPFNKDVLKSHNKEKNIYNTAQETTQETIQETTRDKIIKEIISNPNVTRKQLSKIIGLSDAGIKYHLRELTKDGIIAHKGATKKGYWVVIDNKEKKEK